MSQGIRGICKLNCFKRFSNGTCKLMNRVKWFGEKGCDVIAALIRCRDRGAAVSSLTTGLIAHREEVSLLPAHSFHKEWPIAW